MIIDAHAHVSETDYGNIRVYLAQLQECGITRGILMPGEMPDVPQGNEDAPGKVKLESPEPNNRYILECCQKHPHRCMGFICLNPHRGDVLAKLESGLRQGFRGLKLSPRSHKFSFDNKTIGDLAACCGEFGYPVYAHVTNESKAVSKAVSKVDSKESLNASSTHFITLARRFPGTNFILGHLGFGPEDREGLEAAAYLDNFYLETSTGNLLHLQECVKKAGPGKIIFGSEFPCSHPWIELQKILLLKLPAADQEAILGTNIQALLRLSKGTPLQSVPHIKGKCALQSQSKHPRTQGKFNELRHKIRSIK